MSPLCSPRARLITRSMLSLGMFAARAFSIAYLSLRFDSASAPPWRTADMTARASFVKARARFLSTAPLRAAMLAEWEWPAMGAETSAAPVGARACPRRLLLEGTSFGSALRELEPAACSAATVLLALLHAAVARQQAVLAQDVVEAGVDLLQRARDAE